MKMKTLALALALFSAAPALAGGNLVTYDGPVLLAQADLADAGALAPTEPAHQPGGDQWSPVDAADPMQLLKLAVAAIKSGDWPELGALILIAAVFAIRKFGKKIYDWLPDKNPVHTALWFLLLTKPGGWLMNFATAFAGGLFGAAMGHDKIDWTLIKPILAVALTAAGAWEFVKDVWEWWQARKAPAPAPVPVPAPKP